MRPCFMGPLKGNVTGVGLQVHARTFLCLSCPSSSMFNNDASCGGEGGDQCCWCCCHFMWLWMPVHEPHIHPQVGQGSPNVGVMPAPLWCLGVMYLFGHSGKGDLPGWSIECQGFKMDGAALQWVFGIVLIFLWERFSLGWKNIYTMLQINALIGT